MMTFTGHPVTKIDLDQAAEDLFEKMQLDLKQGYLMCLVAHELDEESSGLMSSHSYTVLDCKNVQNGQV